MLVMALAAVVGWVLILSIGTLFCGLVPGSLEVWPEEEDDDEDGE
jgi:hypothetical protein